jgi:hypothetical protein
MDTIKRGRTFFSTGPLLLLQVDGREPGDEIAVAADAPATVRVRAEMVSITPVDTIEILVNGDIVHTARPTDPLKMTIDVPVPVTQGGWVAARATGPKSKYLGDDYAFAQTSPVYVVRGGKRFVKASDVQFLSDTLDAIWTRVERTRWRSDADRDAFKAAIDRGKAFYRELSARTD